MPRNSKIIVIGLDGASWHVLKPLMEKGELPTFRKLMGGGAYGTLMSPPPCRSVSGIVTFYTGKNSCKWGLFDFPSFEPEAVAYKKIKERAKSIWDILGDLGYRSAILNLPTTYPPVPLKGVMISGFAKSEEEEYAYPTEFKEKVKGFHSEIETFLKLIAGTLRIGRSLEKSKKLLDFYIKNLKKRYGLIKKVIEDRAFDFSIFWIDESDAVCHEGWGNEAFLSRFFSEVDSILKDILENNQSSNIIIISDHGFNASPTHEFFPKSWLKKEGYLKLEGSRLKQWCVQKINTLVIQRPYPYRYWRLEKFLALYKKIKRHFTKTFPQKQNWRAVRGGSSESRAIGIDWVKTIATNQDFWGIRIIRENLSRDYELVREEIMNKMRELKDESGQKIIKNVWEREELFFGPDIHKFPDIVYLPESKFEPTGFLPFCITNKKPKAPSFPGDHLTANEAIFIAAGPDIKNTGQIGQINMVDIAPTILETLGASVPEDMDGRVLKEIIL